MLELFTCRNCGAAYGRAYADNVEEPQALWNEPGKQLRMESGDVSAMNPLDLLLEEPRQLDKVEPVSYDMDTGRVNAPVLSDRVRQVFIRKDRLQGVANDDGERDDRLEARGLFIPCGVCGTTAAFARTSVQDHQTKGDQPFQSLVAKQIQIQPPNSKPATAFAPLRGRKVLVFSDSRQVAARLAPNLQMYSTRDSLRPLVMWGFEKLRSFAPIRPKLSLDDLYLSVLLAANVMDVRLRPEMSSGESMAARFTVDAAIRDQNVLHDAAAMQSLLFDLKGERPSGLRAGGNVARRHATDELRNTGQADDGDTCRNCRLGPHQSSTARHDLPSASSSFEYWSQKAGLHTLCCMRQY